MKRIMLCFISLPLLLSLCACKSTESNVSSTLSGHTHQPAVDEQTISDPISGYCGNTQTTIYFEDDTKYTFMYGESVTMTDILINLDYDKSKLCKCLPEYTVDTEFGTGYGINLTEGYARCAKGQADLTQEQIDELKEIILWAKDRMFDVSDYEKTISYAGWSEDTKIFFGCLNFEQMSFSSVQHIPIFKINTQKDLEDFKTNYGDVLTMNHGYDEIPSFEDATAKYDENFFENNSLFIVYVTANSGSYRFDVESVYCDNDSLNIHVKQTNNPETVTMDMAGWFVTVAVKDDIVRDCRFFDAALYAEN